MYKVIFFCSLILSVPLLEARRSGGGGGGSSRGSSGARTNSAAGGGGFNPNQGGGGGGGFNPNQGGNNNFGNRPGGGGFQQQPNYGNQGGFHGPQNTGFQRPQNFNNQGWNRSPGFSSGTGLGSASRGSTFKYALAGAAVGAIGGLIAFEAGKAIINSATTPFHHQNRDYYFNQENYKGPSNLPRCSIPLSQLIDTKAPVAAPVVSDGNSTTAPPPEQTLANLQFRDGSKPKEVVWACSAAEICCGSDCCPAPAAQNSPNSAYNGRGSGGSSSAGWIALIIILVLLMACCLGCFCVYKFCYSAIERCLPNSQNNQQPGYDNDKYDYNGQPSQSYPMNSYPNQYPQQNYPQQNQYPPAQNYPSYPQPGRY